MEHFSLLLGNFCKASYEASLKISKLLPETLWILLRSFLGSISYPMASLQSALKFAASHKQHIEAQNRFPNCARLLKILIPEKRASITIIGVSKLCTVVGRCQPASHHRLISAWICVHSCGNNPLQSRRPFFTVKDQTRTRTKTWQKAGPHLP